MFGKALLEAIFSLSPELHPDACHENYFSYKRD
jgi:hypothetical protein